MQFMLCRGFFAPIAGACLLMSAKNVCGQEALRISMTGDLAAASQRQNSSSIGYYNLLTGPVAWRFSSGLGLQFNDNVRLAPHAESDLIFQPSLNTEMHWPVTLKNSLDFSLGVGYSAYLQHQDLSQFFITPGSGISFDVYVGDFKINLHDRINITENAYENAGSGNNQNLVSLQNTIGTGVLWDLDKVVANFGYDHVNYLSLSQYRGEPDAASENISGNLGLRLRPELMTGVEAGGTLINYSQSGQSQSLPTPDALQWNAGFFASAQLSDYLSTRLDAGYTVYTPDNTATNLLTQDSSGLYLSLSLSHRVNEHINYSLTAGRSTDLAAYGQAQSYYFVRLQPNWNFFKNYSLSTPFSWQQGTRLYNTKVSGSADYTQFSQGINISRQLTQKLSSSLGYQYVEQTSGQAGLNYTANIVSLNFSYRF